MCFLHFRWYNPSNMKKLFKVIGYILLFIILLSTLLLVAARFLAPQIVEKALAKELAKAGYNAEVDVEIDKLSPFGIDIPMVKVDLGNEELEIGNVMLDVQSLFSSKHELSLYLGELKVNLTDDLLSYMEMNGVPGEKLARLKGRNLSLDVESPYILANCNDVYVELDSMDLGFDDEIGKRYVFSTDGFKATASTKGENLMVTPFDVFCNGEKMVSFENGIYSEGNDQVHIGCIRIHRFQNLPEGTLDDVIVKFLPGGVEVDSSKVLLSGIEKTADFFDIVEAEPVKVLIENGGMITADTALVFTGDRKILDELGLEMVLVKDGERFEVNDGTIFHRNLKGRIPFELAFDGSGIEVEIAGSRRFEIDISDPSESVISEMISFVLLKLASSIFGL